MQPFGRLGLAGFVSPIPIVSRYSRSRHVFSATISPLPPPPAAAPVPPRPLRKGDTLPVRITSISLSGKCIGELMHTTQLPPGDLQLPVHLPKGAALGDVVSVAITKVRRRESGKKHAEGVYISMIKEGINVVKPRCEHFGHFRLGGGGCGGCSMQTIPYHLQRLIKTENLKKAFEGVAKDVDVGEVLGAVDVWKYRNKMEFSFGTKWWVEGELPTEQLKGPNDDVVYDLGLHAPKRFDKVIGVKTCSIQHDVCNDILAFVRQRCIDLHLDAYDTKMNEGYMRQIVLRTANNRSGQLEVMVNLVTSDCQVPDRLVPLANEIMEKFGEVICVIQNIAGVRGTHVVEMKRQRLLGGERSWIEQILCGLSFRISANSFFQTNAQQTEVLYEEIRRVAKVGRKDVVVDLFCGTGAIGLVLARDAMQVMGIDVVGTAIEDARENAKRNNVKNAEFWEADLEKGDWETLANGANVVVVDPPRKGLHPRVIEWVRRANCVDRVVYVSCNATSCVRDLRAICEGGDWRIEEIRGVDMFPHTPHLECVVALARGTE